MEKERLLESLWACMSADASCKGCIYCGEHMGIENCTKKLHDDVKVFMGETFDAGMNKAWQMAINLRYMDYEEKLKIFGLNHDGKEKWVEIMEKFTPQEVKERLDKWNGKHIKPEFIVGDVVHLPGLDEDFAVIATAEEMDENGQMLLRSMKTNKVRFVMEDKAMPTDRHIDLDYWFRKE